MSYLATGVNKLGSVSCPIEFLDVCLCQLLRNSWLLMGSSHFVWSGGVTKRCELLQKYSCCFASRVARVEIGDKVDV